jgi:DNA polymerase-3 subunit epsilon
MRIHSAETLPDLLGSLHARFGVLTADSWSGCRIQTSRSRAAMPGANPDADPDGPFFGLSVCFTGTLSSMTRAVAWGLVAEAGGQPAPGVSKQTDVLVVGTQDQRRLVPGATMSGKQAKAAGLLEAGHPIEVIAEADFLERLAATEGITWASNADVWS